MTPGSSHAACSAHGSFPIVGDRYRRFFVDLDRVASYVPPLPPGSRVLDVGGGEGQFIDHVLARQPELEVTSDQHRARRRAVRSAMRTASA